MICKGEDSRRIEEAMVSLINAVKIGRKINKNLQDQLEMVLLGSYYACTMPLWSELLFFLALKTKKVLFEERSLGVLKGYLYETWIEDGKIIAITDVHGDIESFWDVVKREDLLGNHVINEARKIVLLGDYIDRGPKQLSTLALALLLKLNNPFNVFLLRGNHEKWALKQGKFYRLIAGDEEEMFVSFWQNYLSPTVFWELHWLFRELPAVLTVNKEIGFVHGGPPKPFDLRNGTYDGLNALTDLNKEEIIEEMTWCRPQEKEDVLITGGNNFAVARKHISDFFSRVGWKLMIRGHTAEPKGFRVSSDGKVITFHTTGCKSQDCSNTAYTFIENPIYLKLYFKPGRNTIEALKAFSGELHACLEFTLEGLKECGESSRKVEIPFRQESEESPYGGEAKISENGNEADQRDTSGK